MTTIPPNWMRDLNELAEARNCERRAVGLAPLSLSDLVIGSIAAVVVAGIIFYAVNTALRNAEVGSHLAIAFGLAFAFALVSIAMRFVGFLFPSDGR